MTYRFVVALVQTSYCRKTIGFRQLVTHCILFFYTHTHSHTHPNRGSLFPTYVRVQNEGVDFGKKTLFKFTAASAVYTHACTVTFGGGANFELCVIGDRQNLKRIIYYIRTYIAYPLRNNRTRRIGKTTITSLTSSLPYNSSIFFSTFIHYYIF